MALAIGTTAMAAEKIELGYRQDRERGTAATSDNILIGYKSDIGSNLGWSLDANLAERGRDQRLTNRYSVGLDYNYGLGYVSGKLGQKNVSLQSATNFYQVEAGVKYAVSPVLTAKVGYVYRDAFNDRVDDLQKGVKLGMDYALTKNLSLGAKYDLVEDSRGVKTDRFGVSVSKRF